MTPPQRKPRRAGALWQWATDRWNHTPGYLKWLGVAGLVVVLVLERVVPLLYRRLRAARTEGTRLRTLFGVRWATPPEVDHVQGPYCTVCTTRLRGTLWSGDASPTLWTCPSCGREFTTPEFPDITREAEQRLGHTRGDVSR